MVHGGWSNTRHGAGDAAVPETTARVPCSSCAIRRVGAAVAHPAASGPRGDPLPLSREARRLRRRLRRPSSAALAKTVLTLNTPERRVGRPAFDAVWSVLLGPPGPADVTTSHRRVATTPRIRRMITPMQAAGDLTTRSPIQSQPGPMDSRRLPPSSAARWPVQWRDGARGRRLKATVSRSSWPSKTATA